MHNCSNSLLGCTQNRHLSPVLGHSRQKKKPGLSNKAISGWMDGRGSYTSETRSWSNTFTPQWEREVTSSRGIWYQFGSWFKGKLVEGNNSLYPFDKLSGWRCSDLKMRRITSWEGRSGSRVEVKQALMEHRVYRGSLRAPILGGLIIRPPHPVGHDFIRITAHKISRKLQKHPERTVLDNSLGSLLPTWLVPSRQLSII